MDEVADVLRLVPAAALAVAALMSIAATIGITRRDNSVVDVFWGPAFVVAAFAAALVADDPGARSLLVLALVTAWGVRLALHIGLRRRGHRGEDWRYARLRARAGRRWLLASVTKVYALQWLLALVGSTATFVVLAGDDQRIDVFAFVGTVVWMVGFGIESIADLQLVQFVRRKRAGEVDGFLTTGLWGVSRHPNYLGEVIAWCGIAMIALGTTVGWLGLVSAALVTTLVRWVSGVPMLEREWRTRDGFAEWAARTPVFLPRPSNRNGVPT